MFCNNCSKLTALNTTKKCVKCQAQIYQNISVICNTCSQIEKICSACLKKLYDVTQRPKISGGCKTCGKK